MEVMTVEEWASISLDAPCENEEFNQKVYDLVETYSKLAKRSNVPVIMPAQKSDRQMRMF